MQRAASSQCRDVDQPTAVAETKRMHPGFRYLLRQTSECVATERERRVPELMVRKIENGPQIKIIQDNGAQINGAAFDNVQVSA